MNQDKKQVEQGRLWAQLWMERGHSDFDELDQLQLRLGYRFKSINYLHEALTHRSALSSRQKKAEVSEGASSLPWNERIEFLGDAVLSLSISTFLWTHEFGGSEGELSRKRSFLVNEKSLAQVARQLLLGQVILLGRGEERSGGRERDALLADALEAVIGAVFLDGGFDAAVVVVGKLFAPTLESGHLASQRDYKTELQEWSQDRYKVAPKYHLISSVGPDHAKEFRVGVMLGMTSLGTGVGLSKKRASQLAAQRALDSIKSGELEIEFPVIEDT